MGAVVAFNSNYKLPWIRPTSLQGKPVPERDWVVQGLIPAHAVTMLSGDGGLGKSLLALQLQTCCAIGKYWLGRETANVRSLGFFCEDEQAELHARQAAINDHYGCDFKDLDACDWVSRIGEDNTLVEYVTKWRDGERRDEFEETYLVAHIHNAAKQFGAQLVILDSLHDLYGGNENDRRQARQFIQVLRELAISINGAVVLLAHPSNTGMQSGSGAAGSTAWNNAVRSRLYLTKPKLDPDQEEDQDTRILKTMKANYSKSGGQIRLRWKHGVFVSEDEEAKPAGLFDRIEASAFDRKILEGLATLARNGRSTSDKPRAGNYAPSQIILLDGYTGIPKKEVEKAFHQMLARGQIVEKVIGKNASRHDITGLVEKGWGDDKLV